MEKLKMRRFGSGMTHRNEWSFLPGKNENVEWHFHETGISCKLFWCQELWLQQLALFNQTVNCSEGKFLENGRDRARHEEWEFGKIKDQSSEWKICCVRKRSKRENENTPQASEAGGQQHITSTLVVDWSCKQETNTPLTPFPSPESSQRVDLFPLSPGLTLAT
ncbi:hypothetical protein EK904_009621, partial [Melospiza melodia maxima]